MVTPKVLSWLSMILLVIVGCKKGETNTADSRPQNAASSTSPVKSDAEAIVGKWIPVSGSNVAKPLTERDRELHEIWSFQDGQLSVNGQLVGQYTLLIDETPRRIVLSFGAGLRNDTYMIYELSGDRLKIAVGPEHSTSNFAPSPDTKVTIFRRDFTAATSIPANGVPSAGLAIVSSEVGSAATALASAQIPMSVPSLAVSASDNLDEWLQVAHGNAAAMPAAWFAHLEIAKAETRAGRREAAQQTLRLALEAFKPMEAPQRSFEAEGNYVAIANAQSSAGDRAGARATLSLAAGAHSRELSEGGHDFGQDDFAAAQANAGDFDGAEQTLCGLNGIEKSLASTKIVEAMAKEGNVTRALQIAVNARDPIRCRTVIVHALAESGNEQGLEEVLGASSTKEERANLQLQYLAHSDGAGLKDGIQAGVARALASLGNDALARRSVASELAFVYAKAGDFALASGEADQVLDPEVRIDCWRSIVRQQVSQNLTGDSAALLARASNDAAKIVNLQRRRFVWMAIAVQQGELGDMAGGRDTIEKAKGTIAQGKSDYEIRTAAWLFALRQSEMGDLAGALQTTASIPARTHERTTAESAIALAYARAGDIARMQAMIRGMADEPSRLKSIQECAPALAGAGKLGAAIAALVEYDARLSASTTQTSATRPSGNPVTRSEVALNSKVLLSIGKEAALKGVSSNDLRAAAEQLRPKELRWALYTGAIAGMPDRLNRQPNAKGVTASTTEIARSATTQAVHPGSSAVAVGMLPKASTTAPATQPTTQAVTLPLKPLDAAMLKAADAKDWDGVLALIRKGANIGVQREFGLTVLDAAIESGDTRALRMVLDAGAPLELGTTDGEKPLYLATVMGQREIARILIDRGAKIGGARKGGWTPLHVAAANHNAELVHLLLDKGADPEAKDADGKTPLDCALARKSSSGAEIINALQHHRNGSLSASLAAVCPTAKLGEFGFGAKCTGFYDGAKLEDIQLAGQTTAKKYTKVKSLVHAGVDLTADEGSEVFPIADGTIADLIKDEDDSNFNSLGYMVIVRHKQKLNGKDTFSLYLHFSAPPVVSKDAEVTGGKTLLGKVGHTGGAFGNHLHLEVRHFPDRFFSKWHNIYGKELPAEEATFKQEDFDQNWSDPTKFTTSSTPQVASGAGPVNTVIPPVANAAPGTGSKAPIAIVAERPKPTPEAVAAYEQGNSTLSKGIFKDWKAAGKSYRRAADLGHPRAAATLGAMYLKGNGVEKNEAEAVKYLQKAADAGDDLGEGWLGYVYENGVGVAVDDTLAFKWYTAAAEQGNKQAQLNLGDMYLNGKSVPKDAAIAVGWYQRAADKGFGPAENRLGQILYEGKGVTRDRTQGVKWLRRASGHGDMEASIYMKLNSIR